MDEIRTNMLDLEWNPEAIGQKYQVYILRSQSRKYWKDLSEAADKAFAERNIESACYFDDHSRKSDEGRCVHLLLRRDDMNDELMARLTDSLGDGFTYEPVDDIGCFIGEHERVMAQLLINALQPDAGSGYSLHNLNGKHYCIDAKWIQKNSFKALEFRVENAQGLDELVLSMHVRSFNRIRSLSLSPDGYRRAVSSPQYIVAGSCPKRTFRSDDGNFVMRQVKGRKNTLAFLKMNKYEEFRKSKVGYLFSLEKLFNARYGPLSGETMCSMKFRTIKETASRKFTKKTLDEFEEWIKDQISGQTFNIIDLVSNEESSTFSELIGTRLESFGAKVTTTSAPILGSQNICIIHGPEYYEERELPDPHDDFKEYGVQHIVMDGCGRDEESIDLKLMVMVTELKMKNDLVGSEHRITADDWESHGFKTDLTFISLETVGNDESKMKIMHSMTIRPDGSFDVHSRDVTDDHSNEYRRLWEMEEMSNDSKGTVEGMVMDGCGNVNAIMHSNIITIPGTGISDALKADRHVRNNEFKENDLKGLLDLRMLDHDGELMYYSGSISYSLRSTMQTAPNVRIVKPVRGELFFDDLIELMNVPFVKYKRIASKPYPFKYLNEYAKMHHA